DRNELPRLSLKRYVGEYRQARIVGEAHMLHLHLSEYVRQGHGIRGIADIGLCIQDFEHPFCGSLGLPNLAEDACGGAEWSDEKAGEQDKGKQVAGRHGTIDDLTPPIPPHASRPCTR